MQLFGCSLESDSAITVKFWPKSMMFQELQESCSVPRSVFYKILRSCVAPSVSD